MPKVYKFKKGFKTFAENKSIELRQQLNLKPSYPLPASKLAELLGAKILSPSDIPGLETLDLARLLKGSDSKWSGAALHINSIPVLIINNSHSKARQESTIMHELAHIICQHQMGTFLPLADGVFLRDFNEDQEKEAEWLGGCLQLPRVALHYHYKVYGNSHDEIAEKFNASVEMVRFRLNVCNVRR